MGNVPSAFTAQTQDGWLPSDNGWLAAAGDLDAYLSASSGALTAGTLYLSRISIRQAVTAGHVLSGVQGAGVGASTQTFTGVYSAAGTLLAGSADVSAQYTAAPQLAAGALTGPVILAAGVFVWAAFLFNFATTQPSLYRNGGAGTLALSNASLTSATLRFCTNGTLLTALPASITPSANSTAGALPIWAALAT